MKEKEKIKEIESEKELENKNIENETKEFFNKIKSNEKMDERNVLTFKGYKPIIDLNNCSKDEDFQSCIEAINIFEKNYKDIFDEESKKNLLKEKKSLNYNDSINISNQKLSEEKEAEEEEKKFFKD